MSGISKKLMGTTAAAGEAFTAIEDVFSTYLYSYESNPQTINNGIDLSGEGGLIITKNRVNATDWKWVDTERSGLNKALTSSDSNPEDTDTGGVLSVTSSGYTLGTNGNYNSTNTANRYASWTFRKAPRFFDVVTYTGTGSGPRVINHNLGTNIGFLLIKCTSNADNWWAHHRSINFPLGYGFLDTNGSWNNTGSYLSAADDTSFTLSGVGNNISGRTYVAYLFAHDPLGPSGDGSDGLIACGSYTGTGAVGLDVDLGWEPQWLFVKRTDSADNWVIADNMRGIYGQNSPGINHPYLQANTSGAELVSSWFKLNADGFQLQSTGGRVNASGGTYIYIAIRRGPMRQPTSGTEVFHAESASAGTLFSVGFPSDLHYEQRREATGSANVFASRLTGSRFYLRSNGTNAESDSTVNDAFDFTLQDSFKTNFQAGTLINYQFRRAPGFFDVVAYTGDGVAGRTVPHNLGVAPEMMIVKRRDAVDSWRVYHSGLNGGTTPENYFVNLNNANKEVANSAFWNNTAPASTEFTVGTNVNGSGANYIAYLFATLLGVSKVGSYTGNGTSQTIDCGFTSGARFILIKRTDISGFNWYIFDTERGIVSGNDPALSPNTTDAETSIWDMIDPDASGFAVTSDGKVNGSGGNFIFLAIA